MVGAFALFFLFQAVTNTSCCGVNGCAIPTKKAKDDLVQDVDFEEIK